MQEWKPLLEVLVNPVVAAGLAGWLGFTVVRAIKARWKLRVKVKVVAAGLTSLIIGAAQEGLRVLAEGSAYNWQGVLSYAAAALLVATLGHVAVAKPAEVEAITGSG